VKECKIRSNTHVPKKELNKRKAFLTEYMCHVLCKVAGIQAGGKEQNKDEHERVPNEPHQFGVNIP